jgi:hypothetical protein
MRSAWLWLGPTLLLGLGAFGGCGGASSDGDAGGDAGSAGTSRGGAGTVSAGADSGGEGSLGECDKADCGPQLGLPNWTCADGSVGGPTGRCLARPGGTCGWEINNCPMAGEGGASSQGGQGNSAGDGALGGAAADDCGGCSPDKICVYQVGGPGPSHFICATQNPCGNPAACACIVGQGTCEPNLMGDPPRYCSCDNGLE